MIADILRAIFRAGGWAIIALIAIIATLVVGEWTLLQQTINKSGDHEALLPLFAVAALPIPVGVALATLASAATAVAAMVPGGESPSGMARTTWRAILRWSAGLAVVNTAIILPALWLDLTQPGRGTTYTIVVILALVMGNAVVVFRYRVPRVGFPWRALTALLLLFAAAWWFPGLLEYALDVLLSLMEFLNSMR